MDAEHIGDEIVEALRGKANSDTGSSVNAPLSETGSSEVPRPEGSPDQMDKEEGTSQDVRLTGPHIRISEEGTAVQAPPGLGPPGMWVWPHSSLKERTEKTNPEDSASKDENVSWPLSPVDCHEVEFVGKVAQVLFGSEFIKLTVSWTDSSAIVELHLKPTAAALFNAPLPLLQAMLARDQGFHQCQIFHMERVKDDTSLHITCVTVSANTCWDVLKKGFCPRPNCTWEHPVPVLMNVSCVGLLERCKASLPAKQIVDVPTDKIQCKEEVNGRPTLLTSNGTMAQMTVQLNFGAFDELDDSSDDEM
jgi:hypothetical protein